MRFPTNTAINHCVIWYEEVRALSSEYFRQLQRTSASLHEGKRVAWFNSTEGKHLRICEYAFCALCDLHRYKKEGKIVVKVVRNARSAWSIYACYLGNERLMGAALTTGTRRNLLKSASTTANRIDSLL